MGSQIRVVYNEASIIIDSPQTFISFDQRYALKGYPIPCELFFEPIPEAMMMIESSGIVEIDPDFTLYSIESGVCSMLLIPQTGYSNEKMIRLFSHLLIKFNLS